MVARGRWRARARMSGRWGPEAARTSSPPPQAGPAAPEAPLSSASWPPLKKEQQWLVPVHFQLSQTVLGTMASLKAALDLMRRLPPSKVEENLADLVELAPDMQEDLLSTIDQPLQVQRDSSGREFLTCDYNRDGDSFRWAHCMGSADGFSAADNSRPRWFAVKHSFHAPAKARAACCSRG